MINKEEIEKASFFKVRENRFLDIYIKKPYNKYAMHFKNKYFNSFENYLGESIDVSGKYIILTFVLRNEKDILPYIKSTKPLKYRIKELEEINAEHQKLNGELQKRITELEEIDNKEARDALHMLLHCALKDKEFETQKEQFYIVLRYIKKLEEICKGKSIQELGMSDLYKED